MSRHQNSAPGPARALLGSVKQLMIAGHQFLFIYLFFKTELGQQASEGEKTSKPKRPWGTIFKTVARCNCRGLLFRGANLTRSSCSSHPKQGLHQLQGAVHHIFPSLATGTALTEPKGARLRAGATLPLLHPQRCQRVSTPRKHCRTRQRSAR